MVVVDAQARRLDIELSGDEISARLDHFVVPAPRYTTGALAKFASLVASASDGAVTRPVRHYDRAASSGK
jgi:dihydroxy-acid dehydratase